MIIFSVLFQCFVCLILDLDGQDFLKIVQKQKFGEIMFFFLFRYYLGQLVNIQNLVKL